MSHYTEGPKLYEFWDSNHAKEQILRGTVAGPYVEVPSHYSDFWDLEICYAKFVQLKQL